MDELLTPFGLDLVQSKDHFVENVLHYLHDMKLFTGEALVLLLYNHLILYGHELRE
jgi:hypothetical protein